MGEPARGLEPLMVRVELVNARTGQVMHAAEVDASSRAAWVPTGTVMYCFNEPWEVVATEPASVAEIRLTSTVRLTLRRTHSNPWSTLPRPSSCWLPPDTLEDYSPTGEELTIHVGDWREMELVSRAYESGIREDMAEIEDILAYRQVPMGFLGYHLRRAVPNPLRAASIPAEALDRLPRARTYAGLMLELPEIPEDVPGPVVGGFAFDSPGGITYYGCARDGVLSELCIYETARRHLPANEIAGLASLLSDYDLYLVDWLRAEVVESSGVAAYLARFHGA